MGFLDCSSTLPSSSSSNWIARCRMRNIENSWSSRLSSNLLISVLLEGICCPKDSSKTRSANYFESYANLTIVCWQIPAVFELLLFSHFPKLFI